LPSKKFKPKESLGQNYLSEAKTIEKITNHFRTAVRERGDVWLEGGRHVLELGPGLGALTRTLHAEYPQMMVVELDDRAVVLLRQDMPLLEIRHQNMLELSYSEIAQARGGPLCIAGNLPYNVVSDILFSFVQESNVLRYAFVMVQKEVAHKMAATPGSKEYGALAVLMQLYARPRIAFHVPRTAFYPRPKVTSSMVELEFLDAEDTPASDPVFVREVLRNAFQDRKRRLLNALKPVLEARRTYLPMKWEDRRAMDMTPEDFKALLKVLDRPYKRPSP